MSVFEHDFGSETENVDQAEYGEILLDDKRYPSTKVVPIHLERFQGKFTIGPYDKDSDDLLSSWIQGSWRGGGQKLQLVEGSDDERWWESTLNTEFPEALTLQDKAYAYDLGSATFPVGDYNYTYYVAADAALHAYDPFGDDFEYRQDLPAQPSDHGVVYDGRMWIPCAGSGYAVFDSDGAHIEHHADLYPRSFILWDGKLAAITIEGYFAIYNPIDAWTVYTRDDIQGKRNSLPEGELPRRLVMFHNRSGEPAVHVATDRGIWAWQEDVPRLFPTGAQFPPHPELGLGAAAWRTESVYISAGVGVMEYNGTTVNPGAGLDRNDGLPAELRGYITSLTPEYNGLIALVLGSAPEPDTSDDLWAEHGLYHDEAVRFAPIAAGSSMWKLTTGGWHCLWTSGGAPGIPTASYVSIAGGQYNLWWGFSGTMYRKKLRRDFHTPEQSPKLGEHEFEESGYLVTGKFDAGMRGFDKLASHFEVYLKDALENGESTGLVRVSYRTDVNQSWRLLGDATEPGRTVLPFPTAPNRTGVYPGERFNWIQFRYDLFQPDGKPTYTPVVDSFILKLIKIPLTGRSWEVHISLNHDQPMFGRSPDEMRAELEQLTSKRFIRFTHKDLNTRVVIAQTTGAEMTGKVPFGNKIVSVLEVEIPGHAEARAEGISTPGAVYYAYGPGKQGPQGEPGPAGPAGTVDYSTTKGFVLHGTNPGVARPTGYISVEWYGSVEPANMAEGDTWVQTP